MAASTRTLVTVALGLAGVVVLASGGQAARPAAPPSTPRKLPVPKKPDPKGSVTLGPLTQIFTDPITGEVTRRTEEEEGPTRVLSPAAQKKIVLDAAKLKRGLALPTTAADSNDHSLLTDEQSRALERDSIERARAEQPGASALQQERAREAAIKARSMLRAVPPIPPLGTPVPPRPKPTPEDWDMLVDSGEAVTYRDDGDDQVDAPGYPPPPKPKAAAPKPYTSPPTPINLELARKEAPALAQHIRTKGKGYSKQALRDFQKHAGMTVDGVYGPLSVEALRIFGVENPPPSLVKAKPKN